MEKILNDSFSLNDRLHSDYKRKPLWVKTELYGGHGFHTDPLTGVTGLDEVIFGPVSNTVTIAGVQYAMEMIFGIKGPIEIPTLYSDIGAGLADKVYADLAQPDPNGNHEMPYKYGNRVCLFGIGVTGSAENSITKYPVDYREKSIKMTKTAEDGTKLEGVMIPFRYTSSALSETDQKKYFGKKKDGEYDAYYLKAFENEAVIKHVWQTGDLDEDEESEPEVSNAEVWDSTRTTSVNSFVEMRLRLTEKDVKEFFNLTGRVDEPRFNTIALFSGNYNQRDQDFENVRLFSKLYIPTENMSLTKDLDMIYRVYGA